MNLKVFSIFIKLFVISAAFIKIIHLISLVKIILMILSIYFTGKLTVKSIMLIEQN